MKKIRIFILAFLSMLLCVNCGMSEEEKQQQAIDKFNDDRMKRLVDTYDQFDFSTVQWGEFPLYYNEKTGQNDSSDEYFEAFIDEYNPYYGYWSDAEHFNMHITIFTKEQLADMGYTPSDAEVYWFSITTGDYCDMGVINSDGYSFPETIWDEIHNNPYIDLDTDTHTIPDVVKIWDNIYSSSEVEMLTENAQISSNNISNDEDDTFITQNEDDNSALNSYFQELYNVLDTIGFNYSLVDWNYSPENEISKNVCAITNCYYGHFDYDEDYFDVFLLYPYQIKNLLNLQELPTEKEAFWLSVLLTDDPSALANYESSLLEYWNMVEKCNFIDNLTGDSCSLPVENIVSPSWNVYTQSNITVAPTPRFTLNYGTYAIQIDSFNIISLNTQNNDGQYLTMQFEITGTCGAPRATYLSFDCFDAEEYSIYTGNILIQATNNTNFKYVQEVVIPAQTVRILIK